MWEIETTFLQEYINATGAAFVAFMPLWAAIVGMFVAFALANMVRFLITRLIRQ